MNLILIVLTDYHNSDPAGARHLDHLECRSSTQAFVYSQILSLRCHQNSMSNHQARSGRERRIERVRKSHVVAARTNSAVDS